MFREKGKNRGERIFEASGWNKSGGKRKFFNNAGRRPLNTKTRNHKALNMFSRVACQR